MPANFVSISSYGIALIGSTNTEMGQGSFNLLPMMVAEALNIDWKNLKLVRTGVGPQFGGAVRNMLIAAAAQTWGVQANEGSTTPGDLDFRLGTVGGAKQLYLDDAP